MIEIEPSGNLTKKLKNQKTPSKNQSEKKPSKIKKISLNIVRVQYNETKIYAKEIDKR